MATQLASSVSGVASANQFVVLASGLRGDADALPIRADARVLGATLLGGGRLEYRLDGLRYAYLAPAQGGIVVNGQPLAVGDGLAAVDGPRLTIAA